MKKNQFERKIKLLGLEKVYRNGILQTYSKETREYYIDNEKFNLYGCYKNNEEQFVLFFTDSERGIIEELGHFSTEDEAYDKLFEIVKAWSDTYNQEEK